VAQWNHLGDFDQISGDERCFLPGELWGKDEDYLWYSTGDMANHTDLASGVLGEATLQARYIRGALDDKPFTLGKYESVRIRVAIAELAANGGAPMGFYSSFQDPEARRENVRYYGFLAKYEMLYRANRPNGEVLLLFPRSRVHQGDIDAVGRFKALGRRLLDAHVLFDVLPDDRATAPARERYATVIDSADPRHTTANVMETLPSDRSQFDVPVTVRVSASRAALGSDEITLHFVNYNREESPDKKNRGSGIKDEKPIPAPPAQADVKLGQAMQVAHVEFLTPEADEARALEFAQVGAHLRFRIPEFLVYGVVRIQY
jgi:hypothetical protein